MNIILILVEKSCVGEEFKRAPSDTDCYSAIQPLYPHTQATSRSTITAAMWEIPNARLTQRVHSYTIKANTYSCCSEWMAHTRSFADAMTAGGQFSCLADESVRLNLIRRQCPKPR